MSEIKSAASVMGRKGGTSKSEKKVAAARVNVAKARATRKTAKP